MKEPRRRKDGCCAVCRKPIRHQPRKGINPALYESDPFCSGECARAYYGTELSFPLARTLTYESEEG